MKITGPDHYKLSFNAVNFTVVSPRGTAKFSGQATSNIPKLYVVSVDELPIYVGVTKQSMRNRLRLGWKAAGVGGYYGYPWRHKFSEADLDIWYHEDAPSEGPPIDIETVEAEVVFLIRARGQWPESQTEIHFHVSTQEHRDIASAIMGRYPVSK
jgi:hypothetical protein